VRDQQFANDARRIPCRVDQLLRREYSPVVVNGNPNEQPLPEIFAEEKAAIPSSGIDVLIAIGLVDSHPVVDGLLYKYPENLRLKARCIAIRVE
jgi:hypothetical protein